MILDRYLKIISKIKFTLILYKNKTNTINFKSNNVFNLDFRKMNCMLSKGFIIILIIFIFVVFFINGWVTKNTSFFLASVIFFISLCLIYNQMQEYYAQDDPKLKEIKKRLEIFFANRKNWDEPLSILNEKNFMNNIRFFRGEKSYTINKKQVYICLKDEKGEYYDDNTLYYVVCHEISHVICDEIGHTEKFYRIFNELLSKMEEDGIYDYKIPIKHDYCSNGDPEM
jgi:hypothetical protein